MAQKNIWGNVQSAMQNILHNWVSILQEETTIKVTPQELVTQSSEVVKKVTAMRRHSEDLNSLVRKTKEYWIGDAGEAYRKRYEELSEQIDEILRRLEEHPRDLVEIAQRYTDEELVIEQIAQELPGDILN